MIKVNNLGKSYRKVKSAGIDFPTLTEKIMHPRHRPSYEEFWALRHLSFSLNQGQVLAVIGANGAGKSTLFKILSQITKPTTGSVELAGRVASLLEVGTGFHPELSGRENVFLNGAILGMRQAEIRQVFPEIVEFSGINDFIDEPVKHYSSGMYMRLAFSIAAHLQSEIMIIDEVLAVGDQEFQQKCLQKTRTLVTEEGRTVLLVSHNLSSVEEMADQVLWLDHGQARDFGPTKKILDAYRRTRLDKTSKIS